MLFKQQKPVFIAIHVRKIKKFVAWDLVGGSAIYYSLGTFHSDLIAYGASALTVESVNQCLKRTRIWRSWVKETA